MHSKAEYDKGLCSQLDRTSRALQCRLTVLGLTMLVKQPKRQCSRSRRTVAHQQQGSGNYTATLLAYSGEIAP